MIALIAEKPSVAKDIARIVGATQQNDGYLSGCGYLVTWAFGHLVQLAMPEAYGVINFKRESLPIIPGEFQLIPRQVKADKGYKSDPGVLKQLKVIREVFNQCDSIIVATDAGREGELIFRYIYQHVRCNRPFSRLWISSLTDRAIKEGLNKLKPGKEYENLYRSAQARSEADWLIGINATQALSVAAGQGIFSLGRVQTPTLMMICNRYLENKHFIPETFWQLKITTQSHNIVFSAQSTIKYPQKIEALNMQGEIKNAGQIDVTKVEKKECVQEPPLLYDLTTLQKEANTKLNFSADKTLSIAQSLYEKKVMSYPRTGSRYISEDVFEEIPERIALLTKYSRFSTYAGIMKGEILNPHSVDDNKVTDHHALIITENLPNELSADERAIYELVAGRMLEAFSDVCVKDITSVILTACNTEFSVKGSVMKTPGWRAVFTGQDKEEEENITLPELQEGENLKLSEVDVLEKQTKPKPLHTESSLLAAMENAGKELEDKELKASMKDAGIGTPATRAAIIETLFTRQYIVREKKSLIPTEKGMLVYEIVRNKKIADIEMTGEWENALAKIETGEMNPETFSKGIEVYTTQITKELLESKFSVPVNEKESYKCPKCKGKFNIYEKVGKCMNENCGFVIFRTIAGKTLTEGQIKTLITKGKTLTIEGFVSKAGKKFPAILKVNKSTWKVDFEFLDKKKK